MNCGPCSGCVFYQPNQITVEQRDDAKYRCLNPEVGGNFRVDFGCVYYTDPGSSSINVPDHVKDGTVTDPNPNPVDGPVEVLIVTHYKDFSWLVQALRCARKHLSGFQGLTIAVPNHEMERFKPLLDQFDVRLHGYVEVEGKGMLGHMIKMAEADLFLPPTTKYVLTCDADCMFRMATTPEHYFYNDKPYCIVRTWESLTRFERPGDPTSKVVSDCLMWKAPTDRQVGFDTPIFGMCMNTVVFPIDFFAQYRAHIEKVHNRSFREFMLDGNNSWPQSNMDFTAMVAYAHRFMNERWHWFDTEKPPYPVDRKKAFWSHGGLLPNIQQEIEEFLA